VALAPTNVAVQYLNCHSLCGTPIASRVIGLVRAPASLQSIWISEATVLLSRNTRTLYIRHFIQYGA
jgi:hypothetical protein